MSADNIKNLICSILVVLLLLGVCMTVDYADDTIRCKSNQTQVEITNCTNINGTYHSDAIIKQDKAVVKVKGYDKVHYVHPIIGMWAKPSVRSGYAYKWYYKEFIDYCPHCHHYKVLLKNPKGVPEREYTCRRCGADYCAVTGKEKYSWSHYYLRRA